MELGLFTDSAPELSLEAVLDLAAETGARAVEIAVGGQSSAPHLDRRALLRDAGARARFSAAFTSRGLRIAALNCSAWPLHPVVGDRHEEIIRDTGRLAEALGVETLVTMSGTPGDGPGATTISWPWYPWPEDQVALLDRHWAAVIDRWGELSRTLRANGVSRLAFELHPLHLVYNVPTLERLRSALGPIVGANLDPSHLMWQGMDPGTVARTLGPAVHHVHLKDTAIDGAAMAVAGVLDNRPFEDPGRRAWRFVTVGRAHDAAWWRSFLDALRAAGYGGPLSIEHEDATQSGPDGVREAAAFVRPLIETLAGA
jgi:sugar phosphate isomerase/epimerase